MSLGFTAFIILSIYLFQLKYFIVFSPNFAAFERKKSIGFCRIFTVAILLFLFPLEDSNLAGQSLTFTWPKITIKSKASMKIRRNPLLRFHTVIQKYISCFVRGTVEDLIALPQHLNLKGRHIFLDILINLQ